MSASIARVEKLQAEHADLLREGVKLEEASALLTLPVDLPWTAGDKRDIFARRRLHFHSIAAPRDAHSLR